MKPRRPVHAQTEAAHRDARQRCQEERRDPGRHQPAPVEDAADYDDDRDQDEQAPPAT